MAYVSMFAASVPTAKKDEYVAMASKVDAARRRRHTRRVIEALPPEIRRDIGLGG